MSRASEDTLAALHGAMAEHLTEMLKDGSELKSADLNVMRQFLKDNHVEVILGADVDGAMSKMVETLGKMTQEDLRAH